MPIGSKNHGSKRRTSTVVDNNVADIGNGSIPKQKKQRANDVESAVAVIGIISDTHGVLEKSALAFLKRIRPCLILHAGDVGDKRASRLKPHQVLERLSRNRSSSSSINPEEIAPTLVLACRGNVDDDVPKDKHNPVASLPLYRFYVEPVTGARLLILHGDDKKPARIQNKSDGTLTVSNDAWLLVERYQAQMVIYGHSHRYGCHQKRNVLFLNPGSAGPKRFRLPRTCGCLTMTMARNHQATTSIEYKVEYHDFDKGEIVSTKTGWLNSS